MPVLEFSDGSAPSNRLEKAMDTAKETGLINSGDAVEVKFNYSGATFYSVQIGDKMKRDKKEIDLTNMRVIDKPEKTELKMDKNTARETWDKLLEKIAAGSPPELIKNGGMEDGDPPSYWLIDGSGAIYSRDYDTHYQGSYSLALERNGTDCAAYQEIPMPTFYPDGYYVTLSAWVVASQPGSACISITDGTYSGKSDYHPGDSQWH